MNDQAKFEQMLEYLINEDKAKAEELFHDLVVSKSREIYESLLDDDVQVEEASEEDEEDEEVEENFDFGMQEVGADPADDMLGDLEADDGMGDMGDDGMGDEGGNEPATRDDIMDIKDALEDLKAEFEAMLSGDAEEGDEEEVDFGDEEGDEEGEEEESEEGEESEGNPFAKEGYVREYTEKVSPAKMGDNGANAKSIMAKPNNMGGTTANLRGGESTKGGTQGGLLNPSTKDMSTGNVNVPGGKAGVKHLSKQSGHGAEKRGSGDNGDRSAGSMLNGAPNRAK